MDQLQTWWDIAQVAGAGAALVLGPVAWFLWRRNEKDTDYIRDSERSTLEVLNKLTNVLQSGTEKGDLNHQAVIQEIHRAVETINRAIDDRANKA